MTATTPVSELSQIQFRLMSSEDIRRRAVCEVLFPKTVGTSTLGDERLGPTQPMQRCVVCSNTPNGTNSCAGHFGFIELNAPVVHPLMLRYVIVYLKLFCFRCHRLVFPTTAVSGMPDRSGIDGLGGHIKNLVLENSCDVCVHCLVVQPSYTASVVDGTIFAASAGSRTKSKRQLSPAELLARFEQITDAELAKLGDITHPRTFILTAMPVLPSRSRPALLTETITCEDDQTIQYQEIIKINNHLADTTLTMTKRNKYHHMLAFRIKSLFDNTSQKSRHTNNRALKGLKERIAGKGGLIRCNLMGKRVNMSARTVLGPDVNLPTGWMCVPPKIASTLTVPEIVNDINRDHLQQLVRDGKALYVIKGGQDGVRINLKIALVKTGTPLQAHDKIVRARGPAVNVGYGPQKHHAFVGDRVIRKGEDVTASLTLSERRDVPLATGDIVERHMQDGDMMLFNRQPTLHSGSMIGLRVKVREGNTFRIPLSITKQLGADFDGDEVSTFLPITIEARAELELLSSVEGNFFCAQGSTTYVSLVQDGLLGMYMLTKEHGASGVPLSRSLFMQLAYSMPSFCSRKYASALERTGGRMDAFTLVTMALPDTLCYRESGVEIRRGVMLSGCLTKAHLSGATRSLLFVLGKYWSPRTAMAFTDDMQFLAHAYMTHRGFTIGLADCQPRFDKAELERVMCEGLFSASMMEDSSLPETVRERFVGMALSQTRDIGMKLAEDTRNSNNNFVHTITSGSKGAWFNIAQITTLLGQQNLRGTRMAPQLAQSRTLVCYPFEDMDLDTRFESRGFVRSSFLEGLNPREFFFHAVAGREGVIDTAMKTSTSGYSQRKIVKFMEDVRVAHDGTVRNETGDIIQQKYAYTGLDPKKTVSVNGKQTFCDVKYLMDQCREEPVATVS